MVGLWVGEEFICLLGFVIDFIAVYRDFFILVVFCRVVGKRGGKLKVVRLNIKNGI